MKKLVSVLLLLPFLSTAQKIEKSEIDKFTNQKRVLTDRVKLHTGLSNILEIQFRTVDTSIFVKFRGTLGVGVVGPGDATTFLFEDKTTLDIYPTGIQTYNIETCTGCVNWYDQQYYASIEILRIFATKTVTAIRRSYNSHYTDIDIKEKNAVKLKKLAQLLLDELKISK